MTRLSTLGLLPASLAWVASASAQELPFPLHLVSIDAAAHEVRLQPSVQSIQSLLGLGEVRLTGLVLGEGEVVDLDLVRVSTRARRFGFRVDGQARPDLLDGLDLSVWKGTVAGEPESEVMLGLSNSGCNGWIRHGGQLFHFLSRPDERGSWVDGVVIVTTEEALIEQGNRFELACRAQELPGDVRDAPLPPAPPSQELPAVACDARECKVALESDYQLYQVFNDLNALTAYIATLFTFVSDRYETQANTVLTFPYVQFYTTSNDPWQSQDQGGDCVDVLYEFQAAWAGNIPGGADLAQLLSGANLGCGVAWVDVLCNDVYNFSVAGNMNGLVQFPVQQGPNNWDFMVTAHEMGHNFGALHTHDYCPPLDQCYDNCTGTTQCTNQGTIMSYCHLCSGGTANITTYFHPSVSTIITDEAKGCLPLHVGLAAEPPILVPPDLPVRLSVDVKGTPVGPVELYYRLSGGSYTALTMLDQGGGAFIADLPAPACGDVPEFYFSFSDATCGTMTLPENAPTAVFGLEVGKLAAVLADDFEADLGWTAVNLGATSGDWERGVPVDDPNWDYDPHADHDGSGQCFLTMNQAGNTDVDNGAVELTSPPLDMTTGPPYVDYAYFLLLTNDNGSDVLLVEASSNGASGPWTEIARHDTDGGLDWRTHAITPSDFAAAGINLTTDMRLRFTINDADPQSIVEAGLDAFVLSALGCSASTPIGTQYCTPAVNNSTGQPAVIAATGSDVVTDNDVTLAATQLPLDQLGYFLASKVQGFVPNPGGSQGNLCLGGGIGRYASKVASTGTSGALVLPIDLDAVPTPTGPVAALAGETWNFTCWYLDDNPGQTSNFTDGVSILLQ